ncbi:hypothetical protein HME9302_00501 [Alteripontixanthobacter maritimus]|uniref:Uncharacterized protein n=1 Tax=Alteripontixanthobacter maritimus TaxID=2161824 RepID=A0A369Q3H8_9SPHN|nr:hypothetical protein [Alteripontixanthobacter maritimus]RDC59314.1 hypothetical protein HME9302_00501 [Alteripontixanthobacter maritimus]
MKVRNVLAATAALSLVAAPAIAQADVAVAPAVETNELGNNEDGTGVILALVAAALVIAGIIIVADGDDDDALSE